MKSGESLRSAASRRFVGSIPDGTDCTSQEAPNEAQCGGGTAAGWSWRLEWHVSCAYVKNKLASFETKVAGPGFPMVARTLPFLTQQDVGGCWPNCEHE